MERKKPLLVTGAAGFIGYHIAERLLREGHTIVGADNLNDYYDVALKEARLAQLTKHSHFRFSRTDLADAASCKALFQENAFDLVYHMAAQPGVRYSLVNPQAYVESNLVGFANVLEGCRHGNVRHLVFASSSSVYGANRKTPHSVADAVDQPVSLYAATKKSNELMAHAYAHLFDLACTGLRFFTVYGPWGRPDMAVYGFAKSITQGKTITVYHEGFLKRDFTYIDDIVEGILRASRKTPETRLELFNKTIPYKIYNIGNNHPEEVNRLIALLEAELGRKADKTFLPMQPGDIFETCADVEELQRDVGFRPETPLKEGIRRFVEWFRSYHES